MSASITDPTRTRQLQAFVFPNARTAPVIAFDVLRLLASFGVVVLHTSAPLLVLYERDGAGWWWVGNLFDSAVRWCVPVFVMLSGALLLGRHDDVKQFWLRRARKVVVPLLVWTALYVRWAALRGRPLDGGWVGLLREPAYYHLWFLYMLLGLYALTPLLDAFLHAADSRLLAYAIVVSLVVGSVLPTIETLRHFDIAFATTAQLSPANYLGYYLLGYWLRDRRLSVRGQVGAAAAFLGGLAVTALGTYYLTVVVGDGRFDGAYYEYFSVNVLMMSVGVFCLVRGIGENARSIARRFDRLRRVLRSAAEAAFGVYLIHAMVLEIAKSGLLGFELRPTSFHPALAVPLLSTLVFGLSLLAVMALRRVPGLREVFP